MAAPERFTLSVEVICELNLLAVDGLTANPGKLRARDVVIQGSRHEPPTWATLPGLLADLCNQVNEGAQDAVELAAYVLWRLNWIHPFEEGNGRTARTVAYLVLCAALGSELPGETTLIERIAWQKIRYYRVLEHADAAALAGRRDLSAMTALLRELLEAQLENKP